MAHKDMVRNYTKVTRFHGYNITWHK